MTIIFSILEYTTLSLFIKASLKKLMIKNGTLTASRLLAGIIVFKVGSHAR